MKLARLSDLVPPVLFGISVLVVWQLVVKGFNVPAVLLPAPSDIWAKLITSVPTLWEDFVQTIIRAVIPGWLIGSISGFLAIWLRRCRSSAWRPFWSCGSASTGNPRRRWSW
jgi:ABC-type nitrate/sulfonate/bicarbonate transport system permease component